MTPLTLSELIEKLREVYEQYGDMPTAIDTVGIVVDVKTYVDYDARASKRFVNLITD